jgi:hypothetical protein
MTHDRTDSTIKRAVHYFELSGKSLDELGRGMGYTGSTARKAAWQILNKTNDPRLSMLRRFAEAIGIDVRDLF